MPPGKTRFSGNPLQQGGEGGAANAHLNLPVGEFALRTQKQNGRSTFLHPFCLGICCRQPRQMTTGSAVVIASRLCCAQCTSWHPQANSRRLRYGVNYP